MFGRCKVPLKVAEHKNSNVPAFKHTITVTLKTGDKFVLTHTDYIKDMKMKLKLNPTYQYKHDADYPEVEVLNKVFIGAQIVSPYSSSHTYGSHSTKYYMVIVEGRELSFNQDDMLSIDHVKESIGEVETISHSTYRA